MYSLVVLLKSCIIQRFKKSFIKTSFVLLGNFVKKLRGSENNLVFSQRKQEVFLTKLVHMQNSLIGMFIRGFLIDDCVFYFTKLRIPLYLGIINKYFTFLLLKYVVTSCHFKFNTFRLICKSIVDLKPPNLHISHKRSIIIFKVAFKEFIYPTYPLHLNSKYTLSTFEYFNT